MTKQLIAVFALMGTLTFAEDLKKAETTEAKPSPAMTEAQTKDVEILALRDSVLGLRDQVEAKNRLLAEAHSRLADTEKQLADAQSQLADINKSFQQSARNATIKAICDDKKIPAAQCSIDQNSGQVVAKPLPINPAQ